MTDKVRRLSEHRQAGVSLLHSSACAKTASEANKHIALEITWAEGAVENTKPWPALCARLEPLGEIKPEEQRILNGMSAQNAPHAMSIVCLAVRLHRIDAALEDMAAVPVKVAKGGRHKGDGEIDDSVALSAMRVLWKNGANSFLNVAEMVVDSKGSMIGGNSRTAKIYRLRKKFSKLVSKPI